MDPVETIINLYPTPEEGWDLVEILLRSHPVVTFLENLLPGDCDTVVAALKNLLWTQPEPLRRDCDTVVAALENLLRVSPAPALQTQPEPLHRDCDTVVAASVESLLRLYPSPEEQRELRQLLERLHPADARTFVENLLPLSPVPALQTQPEPLRRHCDTVVAASVLCEAVSADSPNFVCNSDDYFYGAQYDVDYSDYSD